MTTSYDIPYVPSEADRVITMIELASVKPGQKAVDLGCGDGRILIALAEAGAREVHGYEIDQGRADLAKRNVESNGARNVHIHNMNFWDADLTSFDIVTFYAITSIMERLQEKLQKELKTGAKVISNVFTFPTWKPSLIDGKVYLYLR